MRRSFVALALALVLPLPAQAAEVTVKPGETLSEIADRLGVSMQKLMDLNGISKADHVEVGQRLKVPGSARGPAASRGGGSGGGVATGKATGKVTVQEGDTLSEIADRQGMSLSQLMALNGISKADHVEVGQTLKVTGRVNPPSGRASDTAAATPAYRKGASVHVVRSGESLSEIADGYGVPMSRLVAINAISDPDHVEVGSQLKLKGEPPAPRPKPQAAAQAPAPRPQPVATPMPRPAATTTASEPSPSREPVTQATASAAAAKIGRAHV